MSSHGFLKPRRRKPMFRTETVKHLPSNPPLDRFSLGPWQVNVSLDEVTGQGQVHKLEPRAMRLLVVLAQAGGEVVLTHTLMAAVWPGLVVTPSSLYDAVAQLRKVLGIDHIATVTRKGYRLATPVVAPAPISPPASSPASAIGSPVPEAVEPRLGTRSVAVLPFGGQSLPDSLSFLSESVAGALIAELSRQPGLTVVALGTMLSFGQRHTPPRQLTDELGVRYVVDGQLELRADTLHVSVQVVDGQRGTQTWADDLTVPASAWHETATVVVGRLARAANRAQRPGQSCTGHGQRRRSPGTCFDRTGLGPTFCAGPNARNQRAGHAAGALGAGLGS